MSFAIHGLAVSSGIAIGHAHLVSHARLEVEHYVLPGRFVDEEVARFDQAVAEVQAELDALMAGGDPGAPSELTAFIDLHQMLLADPMLIEATRPVAWLGDEVWKADAAAEAVALCEMLGLPISTPNLAAFNYLSARRIMKGAKA